jgi:pentatricopeptide repeat protein
MLCYGVLPNKFTFPFVLKACAGIGNLRLGKLVHGCVVKFGFEEDVHVMNTLIHMYCCCEGDVGFEFAHKVFDDSPKLDTVTWSAMIGGYVRLGRSAHAVGLFREMQVSSFKHDLHLSALFFLSIITLQCFKMSLVINFSKVMLVHSQKYTLENLFHEN